MLGIVELIHSLQNSTDQWSRFIFVFIAVPYIRFFNRYKRFFGLPLIDVVLLLFQYVQNVPFHNGNGA